NDGRVDTVVRDGVEDEDVELGEYRNREHPINVSDLPSVYQKAEQEKYGGDATPKKSGGHKATETRSPPGSQEQRAENGPERQERGDNRYDVQESKPRRDRRKPPGEEMPVAIRRRADIEDDALAAYPKVLPLRSPNAALAKEDSGEGHAGKTPLDNGDLDGAVEVLGGSRKALKQGMPVGDYVSLRESRHLFTPFVFLPASSVAQVR